MIRRWLRWFPTSLIGTLEKPRHFSYKPTHPVCVREHGPDVPAGFFMTFNLPVISAGAFERVEPDRWCPIIIQESRN